MNSHRFIAIRWIITSIALFTVAGAAFAQSDSICNSVPTLSSGDSVERTITDRDYIFAFCFDAAVSDDITVEVNVLGGDLNAFLAVFPEFSDDGEDPVAELDPLNERITPDSITFSVPENGTYIIGIARVGLQDGNTTGPFSLTYNVGSTGDATIAAAGECPANTKAIEAGQEVTGTITDSSYFSGYCIVGAAGETLTINAEATDGTLDTLLLLTDTNVATNFGENDDCESGTTDSCLEVELPESGTYLIAVGRYGAEDGSSSGDFALTIESDGAGTPVVGGAKDPVPGSTAIGDCDSDPLATLVAGLWEFNLEDEGFRTTFDFDCDGGVVVEIEEITDSSSSTTTTTTTYTLEPDGDASYNLVIDLDNGSVLNFTNTIIAETGILGLLDGESLIILLNVR